MDHKKDAVRQILEINSVYNIKGAGHLLDIFEKLALDEKEGSQKEKTSLYFKKQFNMREADIGKYIDLIKKCGYFKLRAVFDSLED